MVFEQVAKGKENETGFDHTRTLRLVFFFEGGGKRAMTLKAGRGPAPYTHAEGERLQSLNTQEEGCLVDR